MTTVDAPTFLLNRGDSDDSLSSSSSSTTTTTTIPIIDLRDAAEFAALRFKGSVNLPWPDVESGVLGCELPPRDVIFDLVLPSGLAPSAAMGFFGATKSKATGSSRTPWRPRYVVAASASLFDHPSATSTLPPSPGPHLWRPDSMVSSVLVPLLTASPSPGSVIDLGSGAGRDVAYLAERLPQARVYGVDNHKGAGRRCLPLWRW